MSEKTEKPGQADWVAKAAAGRSLDAQIAAVREQGNHGAPSLLRAMALGANGVGRPAVAARNALVFGCYRPFSTPYIVRDAVALLTRLGVDFTWLEKEYCCGLPLLHQAGRERSDEVMDVARESVRANRDMAGEKGADTLVYCCAGCAHAAKGALPDEAPRHAYLLDTLLDALVGRPLRLAPRRVAYFEGCHTSYRKPFPASGLDWPRYRAFLDGVAGLTVQDVAGNLCCKVAAEKIVAWVASQGLDTLVCACSGCNVALRQAGAGRIRVMSYPELLVEAVGEV
ncbi:(Fe-S)-binding protein [Solidesulfovibrio alcoholivorans]|uniref:(Fe-S)-binding protein n=1 Tax=Solidesulfovibrio alcoholivorans TaxID=81406 RepID=UPI0004951E65|nr:(Fe-S)-binding protein [Solidesulfovibrio alcoholivorans]